MAIRKRRELNFEYRGLNQNEFLLRKIHPYELVLVDHQWYLFAFDLDRKAIRSFVPGRLRSLKTTENCFTRPKSFSAAEHLKDSFGVFSGGTPQHVVISFDQFASQLVRERKWHPSQSIRELQEGKIELSMTLGSFQEVERWILSWGNHAVLISPPDWVAQLKKTLELSLSPYA